MMAPGILSHLPEHEKPMGAATEIKKPALTQLRRHGPVSYFFSTAFIRRPQPVIIAE